MTKLTACKECGNWQGHRDRMKSRYCDMHIAAFNFNSEHGLVLNRYRTNECDAINTNGHCKWFKEKEEHHD